VPLRPGVQLPGACLPHEVPRLVALAERHGVSTLWATEVRRDPFLQIAAVLGAGGRMGVGTAVAVAFARSPTVTAAAAWDLNRWSGGHFRLGLGSQTAAMLKQRFGVEADHLAPRMADYVAAVRDCFVALRRGFGGHRGPFYGIRRPALQPGREPAAPPDPAIMLAAVNQRMAETVGASADALCSHPFTTPAYLAEVLSPALARGARASGRSVPAVVQQLVVVSSRPLAARQMVPYAIPAYREVLAHSGRGALIDGVLAETAAGRIAAAAKLLEAGCLDDLGVVVARDADQLASALERWSPLCSEISLSVPWFGIGANEQMEAAMGLMKMVGRL